MKYLILFLIASCQQKFCIQKLSHGKPSTQHFICFNSYQDFQDWNK